MLDESFGPGWTRHLQLEEQPVGVGCVAQVHRGTLTVNGEPREVAVKILHPHIKVLT